MATLATFYRALVKVDHDPTDFEVAMGHERGELFMIRLGWKYDRAHEVGNFCERLLHGIIASDEAFATYDARIEKHADAIESLPITRCPPDLALYPYADSKESSRKSNTRSGTRSERADRCRTSPKTAATRSTTSSPCRRRPAS